MAKTTLLEKSFQTTNDNNANYRHLMFAKDIFCGVSKVLAASLSRKQMEII